MRRSVTNTSRRRDRLLIQKNILVTRILFWPVAFLEIPIRLIPLPLSLKSPIWTHLYSFWVFAMSQESGQQVDICLIYVTNKWISSTEKSDKVVPDTEAAELSDPSLSLATSACAATGTTAGAAAGAVTGTGTGVTAAGADARSGWTRRSCCFRWLTSSRMSRRFTASCFSKKLARLTELL